MTRNFRNKKVSVLGLQMEGRELVDFFIKRGAEITVYDQKEKSQLDFDGIDKNKIKLVCGKNYLSKGLNDFNTVFRSPGFYRFMPEIVEAEKSGAEISSAIKVFFDLCPGKIIGVTGTKGKGTTATLIYEILKSAGRDVYLAGNIGKPFLELLPKLNKNSWIVLELSSFQLIDLTKSSHIAVVLNITSDHLDWHKDRKEYVDAKKNIVKHQGENDFAVVNCDYKDSKSFSKLTRAQVYYFSKNKPVFGSYVKNNQIYLCINKRHPDNLQKLNSHGAFSLESNLKQIPKPRTILYGASPAPAGAGQVRNDENSYLIGKTSKLKLRGEHNWENVTAAICASYLADADIKSIKKVVFSFKGLEHRLELVAQPLKGNPYKVREISFYNDSFSTNPQTTTAAINSFDEPITLILGGFDKGLKYDGLAKEIQKKKNVKTIVLIGDIAPKIKKALKNAKFTGKVFDLKKSSMKKIVQKTIENTPKGGIVLLSPASSSFDMFENYKVRGNQFIESVKLLTSK